MTNKTRNQRLARRARAQQQLVQAAAKLQIAPKPKKPKKKTPFADVGSIVGGGLGKMFSFPAAQGIGRWLGTGIGSIFGSGDYEVVGQQPAYNVLANGNQIPKFSTTRQTNIVSHREFLGDINGTTAFTNRVFPINPGSSLTFPWLSTIAQCYQQYKIHGIIFEFRPLITDFVTSGAPGVVVMATNYNADEPAYLTKQAMENSEYAVSVKPTCNLMHGVECASNQTVLSELYVRPAGLASNLDLKFTDLGNFQFATQGNPVQLLGELWCSYTVEFFKPLLPDDVGGNVQSQQVERSTTTAFIPLGNIPVSSRGDMVGFTVSPTTITFLGQPGNLYLIDLNWVGTVATAITYPTISLVNGTLQPSFHNQTATSSVAPTAGVLADKCNLSIMIKCTATSSNLVVVTFGVGGAFPAGTSAVDILLTQVSNDLALP
jgi:hypothetical protein